MKAEVLREAEGEGEAIFLGSGWIRWYTKIVVYAKEEEESNQAGPATA